MKKSIIAILLMCVSICAGAQIQYTWHPVPMDSTWDTDRNPAATQIIEKYKPLIAPLQEILCYTPREYRRHFPESELSNMQVDIIRLTAEKLSGSPVDIALTNFGGIRTDLPKGAVRVYDIYSIFPFDNTIVYFDIKGSDLRALLGRMTAKRRFEVLSNVEIVMRGSKVEKLNVAGAPIDDEKVYRMATINFLMTGGDGITLEKVASNVVTTEVFIRDAIVNYLRDNYGGKKPLDLATDGRIRLYDSKEENK